MARIHTHYDNLKVARKAPQEVIRAAYKALSQKYHPDKNPGDEKAARIMAILNSAYGTLSDPLRRREHDDWIAAEEWEIAWLESTQAEEKRELLNHDAHQHWQSDDAEAPPAAPAGRSRWWLALVLGLALGAAAGAIVTSQRSALPSVWVDTLGMQATPSPAPLSAPAPVPVPAAPPAVAIPEQPAPESWAVAQAHVPEAGQSPPEVKTLGVMQLVIPARAPDCDMELHRLVAANGEPWPAHSGYLEKYPLGNEGSGLQINLDNTDNPSPVLVKVIDLDRRATVRHLYLLANDTLTVDNLAPGRYEVRYQNIHAGGSRDDCLVRRKRDPAGDSMVQAFP